MAVFHYRLDGSLALVMNSSHHRVEICVTMIQNDETLKDLLRLVNPTMFELVVSSLGHLEQLLSRYSF